MNRWRLFSGITSVLLGIGGYIYLVAMCVTGVIPMDLNADLATMMQTMMDSEDYLLLGYSGVLTEMLFIAGIVNIITFRKRWYCNIPVALMMAQGTMYGFMGYKVMYPWAVWAAVCLFMSIVAMRVGYRELHAPAQPDAQEPQNTPGASDAGRGFARPFTAQQTDTPYRAPAAQAAPVAQAAPDEKPAAAAQDIPAAPDDSAEQPDGVAMPPRAIPVDDYE